MCVFLASPSRTERDRLAKANVRAAKLNAGSHPIESDDTPFPPLPLNPDLSRQIVQDFCAASSPNVLEEAGCAVCGRLTPIVRLSPLKNIKRLLHILDVPGVTRIERKSATQKIRSYQGPVLDYSCDRVCDDCRGYIRKGDVPKLALANGLWIGKVPDVLSSLNFMEKLLVARVRHNCNFIRVASSGRRKMIAHLVAFESPLPKVYEMLPPPVEDLDDVLAILFTGPCKPTEEEFKRSPVLVRRHAIRAALEWLILNHSDYADVKISAKNLAEYPETSPIVSVVYRERGSDKISEATSIHDTGEGDGVESALKGMAMEHWNSGGMALRVGQHNKMESIYNNPDLYPQMFPWLFPYGLGGVGSTSLSDDLHKKHLLMYHDKRFQTDLAFPFAAFSHRQIKAAATGGYLAVDSKNFDDITDRLLSVNQDVLGDIAKRMAQGEVVKPVTEDEKACFQVIRDLDHVGGKVDGSVSSKKYMRNEIWSLVANQGAPSWYITLSPSDMSHPICLYFADEKETFQPLIRGYDERFRLIAKNPVAAARFFDFMVKLFIKHVLGFGTDHAGIYGETSAYYGTVEQQGRLTLHLHLLLWIRNGLTPEEARKAIMDPDSPFQQQLVRYLEAAHQGEFCTGSMDDVDAALTVAAEDPTYQNPTLTLPEAPPEKCTDSFVDLLSIGMVPKVRANSMPVAWTTSGVGVVVVFHARSTQKLK
ncbi:hypothetical protein D9615_009822 [Tricholomella constricta]|uniref:Helitron helicase-like domain-containing protein n=1 Tax=Tricholomella constricta TaxID=117010 RepID=A0A8H5LVE9_9AGAR|nr:hypothetical protein D9615_009822 [Tricholomella constricta]